MTDMWMGYSSRVTRRDLARALKMMAPFAVVTFAASARELRASFRDEEPGAVGAIVGLTDEGVSDVNLAAALAYDGRASEVVLVSRHASGSMRSRAARAGVRRVIDLHELDGSCGAEGQHGTDAESVDSARGGRGEAKGAEGRGIAPLPPRVEKGAAEALRSGRAEAPIREDLREVPGSPRGAGGKRSPLITFASGRGGMGKTALVAACGALGCAWGLRTALVDLDLSCGNLHSCFGALQGSDLSQLASGELTPERMGRSCVRLADDLLLWGPCERPETADSFMPQVPTLLSYLRQRFDLVLVDTSTTFTEATAHAAQLSDRLVLVGGPDEAALSSVGRAGALAVRLGVARTRIARVENFADLRVEREPAFGRAEVGLEGARVFRVPDVGAELADMLCSGEACALMAQEGEFAVAVASLLAQLLSELGHLPDCDAAKKAFALRVGHRRFSLFGRRKEA